MRAIGPIPVRRKRNSLRAKSNCSGYYCSDLVPQTRHGWRNEPLRRTSCFFPQRRTDGTGTRARERCANLPSGAKTRAKRKRRSGSRWVHIQRGPGVSCVHMGCTFLLLADGAIVPQTPVRSPRTRARDQARIGRLLIHSGLEFLLAAYVVGDSWTSPRRHGRLTHQPEDVPYGWFGGDLPCYPPLSHGTSRFEVDDRRSWSSEPPTGGSVSQFLSEALRDLVPNDLCVVRPNKEFPPAT